LREGLDLERNAGLSPVRVPLDEEMLVERESTKFTESIF